MLSLKFDLFMIFVIIIFVILYILFLLTRLKRGLIFLKFILLFFVFIFCIRPVYVKLFYAKPKISFLIDTSYSMNYGKKLNDIKRLIKNYERETERHLDVSYFEFAEKVKLLTDINELKVQKSNTNIADALLNCKKETSGIVLFSDGFHNTLPELSKVLPLIEVPVYPVIFEKWKDYKDITISDLSHPNIAFKNLTCEIQVTITATGCNGEKTNIVLKDLKGEMLQSKAITIDKDFYLETISLSFIPTEIGEKIYTVKIDAVEDEITKLNNEKTFEIFVTREKIRVLYLCGRPNYEYLFLRRMLKNNPLIELVSFVILRNPENIALAPEDELSLIPFPTHTLFTKDIYTFDVLIFENFTYRKFPITFEYLSNVVKFVKEKSGGFIMIGGEDAFGRGWYKGTPLEEILPVVLDPPNDEFVLGLYKPTIINPKHQITKFVDDEKENIEIWRNLPPLDGAQKLGQKDRYTLISHPQGFALVSAGEFGKGRVVAVGTNTTWRWAIGSADLNLPFNPHEVFWKNLVYWVAKVPTEENYKIVFPKSICERNEKIEFRVIPMDKTLLDKKITVKITKPDKRIKYLDPTTFTGICWEWIYEPDEKGTYVFEFLADFIKTKEQRFLKVHEMLYREEKHIGLDVKTLMKIADETGGRVISDNEFDKFLSEFKNKSQKVIQSKIEIWNSVPFLILFIGLFICEWVTRKILEYH